MAIFLLLCELFFNMVNSNQFAGCCCAVVGYGSWATALVKVLTDQGNRVAWYVPNNDVRESLLSDGRNPKYLRDLEFDTTLIVPSDDLNCVAASAPTIILAMPSAFVKTFLAPLTISIADRTVVSAVKGIVPDDYVAVTEYVTQQYGVPAEQMAVITGPTHAEEVGMERLSYLTVVASTMDEARRIGTLFDVYYLHLAYSTDLKGVEYAVILKNIYAVAVGMAVGLNYGDNFIAVLITACADEMRRFLDTAMPFERNLFTPPYLGDLLVTCNSTYSRNRRFGLLIGHGCSVKSAINEMTMIAEGYYGTYCIRHVFGSSSVDVPIADMVYEVLYGGASARREMKKLIQKLQ